FQAVVVDANGESNTPLAQQFLDQMIRCSPSGTAVPGVVPYQPMVQRTADDKILFAFGGCMLKLDRDGVPDPSFGSGGISVVANAGLAVRRLLLLKDGSILSFSLLADASSYRVTKRLANGMPDSNFGVGGIIGKLDLPVLPVQGFDTLPSGNFDG